MDCIPMIDTEIPEKRDREAPTLIPQDYITLPGRLRIYAMTFRTIDLKLPKGQALLLADDIELALHFRKLVQDPSRIRRMLMLWALVRKYVLRRQRKKP